MIRLFSRFDLRLYLKSMLFTMLALLTLVLSFVKINLKNFLIKIIFAFITNLSQSIKREGPSKFFILSCITLFFYLFYSNYSSILSFNFASNSQIRIVIFSSLCFWSRFIFYMILNNIKYFIRHCIPQGTPIPLVLFLFIIELIRQIIRPLTLTVRLVANILAGHLLMILLSKLSLYSIFIIIPYILLNTVEILVSLIQAYIMITIIMLYYAEVL